MTIDTSTAISLPSPPAIIRQADGSLPPLKAKWDEQAATVPDAPPRAIAAPPKDALYRYEDLPKAANFSGACAAVADVRMG